MTQAHAPLQLRAHRLAAHDDPLPHPLTRLKVDASRGAVVAYESPELAALCTFDALHGVPVLLRETLRMPGDPTLHRHVSAQISGTWSDDARARREFFRYLKANGLLYVWVPCALAPEQHMLLIDPEHPAYGAIQVESRYVNVSRADVTASAANDGPSRPAAPPDYSARVYPRLRSAARLYA